MTETETRALLLRAREALSFFLEDERFVVTMGGNPIVVERTLAKARVTIAEIDAALEPAERHEAYWQERLDRFRNDGSCEKELLAALQSEGPVQSAPTITDKLLPMPGIEPGLDWRPSAKAVDQIRALSDPGGDIRHILVGGDAPDWVKQHKVEIGKRGDALSKETETVPQAYDKAPGLAAQGPVDFRPSAETQAKIQRMEEDNAVACLDLRNILVGSPATTTEQTQAAQGPVEPVDPVDPNDDVTIPGSLFRDMHAAYVAQGPVEGWRPIISCPTDGRERLLRLPDGTEVPGCFKNPPGYWRVWLGIAKMPAPKLESIGGAQRQGEPYTMDVYANLPDSVFPTHYKPNIDELSAPPPPTDAAQGPPIEPTEAMLNAAPPPPTDTGLREKIARIIHPASWELMDSYLAQAKRHYKGQDVGWPEDQFWDKPSLQKADAILAALSLPPPPEGLRHET